MKFVIGSTSKRKINVVRKVAAQFFDTQDIVVEGYDAKSLVPDTPYDKQTYDGARNRAYGTKANVPNAQYYIGLESGLVERYGHIYEEAWTVIITQKNKEYYGYSSGLKVPDYIIKKMNDLKMEHSEVMTIIEEQFGKLPNDTWGTYSGGIILRETSLEEAIRNALIQAVAPSVSFYNKS